MDDVRIYAGALDADQLASLFARGDPDVGEETVIASLPEPVVHYAFETSEEPGFDSAAGAHHLDVVKSGSGASFQFVDSPLGGKALQFAAASGHQTYLQGEGASAYLPASGEPYTVSLWVQTASGEGVLTTPPQHDRRHADLPLLGRSHRADHQLHAGVLVQCRFLPRTVRAAELRAGTRRK